MKQFTSVDDISDPIGLVKAALSIKKSPMAYKHLGKDLTLGLIFMNPSLRTRLSTQKAAQNMGMNVMIMNVGSDGWHLETEDGIIMNGDKAEHVKEAAAVIGQYCNIIGLRSFPGLTDRKKDYKDVIINSFMRYSGVPIISLESAIYHPLQGLADLMTIEELKVREQPKVVLSWAPHVKALPQSVPNSFSKWVNKTDYGFVITHPEGYELAEDIIGGAQIEYDQNKAFEGADFIYTKNWSSYRKYGKILSNDKSWMVDEQKMSLTSNGKFMHCLPVRRNQIVSDAVLDGPQSVVIRQAANREFSAQAVLKRMIEDLL